MGWTIGSPPDQSGKTYVVTGANVGIGFATVNYLAATGARVVMACRNVDKGNAALADIRKAIPIADVVIEKLDLASLTSVRFFADRILAKYSDLDVLINNAGVALPPQGNTEDGFEIQFGTNVLGHFALTGYLLPLLLQTSGSRVVTLSSTAHWFAKIDFDNLNAERGYNKTKAYGQSKLANLILAYELQRRLQNAAAPTMSLAAHPGVAMSELFRYNAALNFFMGLFSQSIHEGAWPTLMAASDPSLKGGEFIGPGGFLTIKGKPAVQKSSPRSHDLAVATRLWDVAQDLTGVKYL